MTSFQDFQEQAPELSERVHGLLTGRVHHVLGTLRKDGFPRLSGIEVRVAGGELYWGSNQAARKTEDLLRDPRFSLHSGTVDPPEWQGDVKIIGRAEQVSDREREAVYPELKGQPFCLFKADIQEVALVSVQGDKLIIDMFHNRRGLSQTEGS